MNVFITVDVEVWCKGWKDFRRRFTPCYNKYIYGNTRHGAFGLPYQIKKLNEHNLQATFFVEPLYADCFSSPRLAETVHLLTAGKQDVQLHLHPEWINEASNPIVAHAEKRQFMHQYNFEEQRRILAHGASLLESAGAAKPVAFRAGSFGANENTLLALHHTGFVIDSSQNPMGKSFQAQLNHPNRQSHPRCKGRIQEYPLTTFIDGFGRARPMQIGSCSSAEMKQVLLQAYEQGLSEVVILLHNFELLSADRLKPDFTVIKRFDALCEFLDNNRQKFSTISLGQAARKAIKRSSGQSQAASSPEQRTDRTASPIKTSLFYSYLRLMEQTKRRLWA